MFRLRPRNSKPRVRSRHTQLRAESLEQRLTMAGDAIVSLSLEAVDLDGNVLTKLTVNQPFDLRIVAEDLRNEPDGVFAAYMDVLFPADKVAASGSFKTAEPFINAPSGSIGDGILDEVGSFSNSFVPLGGGRSIIGSYRFVATSPGSVVFQTDPADDFPAHDVLVYGRNVEVGTGNVTYNFLQINSDALRSSTLTLIAEGEGSPELIAVDDYNKLLSDSDATTLNVLSNDTIPVGATVSLVSVTPAGGNGSAQLSTDKQTILYKPATGMIGSETLTYVVRDQSGNESSAKINIDVASRFQNQATAQDRDNNGKVVPLDALIGINALNQRGPKKLEASDLIVDGQAIFFDVNGDGFHSAIDELLCINMLNQGAGSSEGEGDSSVVQASPVAAPDALFATYQSSDWSPEPTAIVRRRR